MRVVDQWEAGCHAMADCFTRRIKFEVGRMRRTRRGTAPEWDRFDAEDRQLMFAEARLADVWSTTPEGRHP